MDSQKKKKKKITGFFMLSMYLESTGREKNGSFKGKEKGGNNISVGKADEVKIQEDSISHSSPKIKTVTSDETIGCDSHPRKRSPRQNPSSLPSKKRPKLSGRHSISREEQTVECKEEEFDESQGENDISSIKESDKLDEEELDEPDEEELEEARRTCLLVAEHQALLRRRMELLKDDTVKNQNPLDCDAPVDYDYALRHWRAMSSEQKARANCLALQIQKGNPAFVHVLQQSCLTKSSRVVVPKQFSAKHLPEGNQTFVLHRPEKEDTWSVRYYFRKSWRSIEGSSWVKFVQENNLQEGDVCMFELVNSAHEIAFNVHVSRAT